MKNKQAFFFYDPWIIAVGFVLIFFGLLMVSSASMVISDQIYHDPFHYVVRQLIFLLTGFGIAWGVSRIPLSFWEEMSFLLLLLCFFVLLAVLIPGIGRVVNGSRRWIHLGFISLQVSEAVKLMAILYLAGFLQRHLHEVQTRLSGFIKPLAFFVVMAVLLLCEPDFGTTAVIAMTVLSMLFIAGARLLPFIIILSVVILAMIVLAVTTPYRMERLTSFLNPWTHAYGTGYQLTQSLIAFGRGGLFGVGLGNSVQKLFYLPEAHTDFIFAVIGEELGLAGELLLIGLFVALIARIIYLGQTALRQEQWFGGFASWGIALWLAFQTIINIGVNIGLLPTKGLTLPLISYGGSSLWMSCAALGIVLRVAHEAQTRITPPTSLSRMRQRVS
ncbi:MAG: putative lipid II flippase FtsW [Gammaproteobacteria bacterium CG_4_10_14_0_8_um_filter_38_16]|nr:MAG: putative lipid II flippase FtsW [Gammaproteobacteria bacterium CG_4_10_14_0_8_um_filter_38_16]PJA03795.1 MAG: putative lipid II flippase FtsW [Gammaproteobacteria bacterium CG_4_10_14_0_2_um_filter_38_22]PJB10406.1 MAG: putative lipid II flippase FtsW [Gammaproteobacteria bacterium CG_4_9_14_3_um_filter_38_9]